MTEHGKNPIAEAPQPVSQLSVEFREARPAESLNAHHLATAHLLTGLKGRAISSSIVTILAQITQLILNLASIVVLARMLTPEDFGLVAMVTTITGFLWAFNDAGLSTATVQKEGISHAQVSNLFWTNLALGGVITLIVALSAPVLAWFYREPRLSKVTLALCITFLLTSSSVQHLALLKRQMRFKMIALIQVGSLTIGVVVGITMAWLGFGYWCLVGMQLTQVAVACLLSWTVSRWLPQLPTRNSGTRSLLNFGANLTASSFLWSLARGSDGLLIGRVYGSAALGLYTRAGALLSRPVERAMAPLEAVFVPTLSRLQDQPERYRRVVFQVYEVIAVGSFMFSGMFLALAHPLTLALLGPKWANAAPIFAAFTLLAVYTPVVTVPGWLLSSQGRGGDFLVLSSINSSVTVLSFLVGLRFGPVGIAICYSLSCLLLQLPASFYIAGRKGLVTTRELWTLFFKHLPIWGVVGGTTYLIRALVTNAAPLMQLLICGTAGLLIGVCFICLYPPSRRAALSLSEILQDFIKSRKTVAA